MFGLRLGKTALELRAPSYLEGAVGFGVATAITSFLFPEDVFPKNVTPTRRQRLGIAAAAGVAGGGAWPVWCFGAVLYGAYCGPVFLGKYVVKHINNGMQQLAHDQQITSPPSQ